ncbi:MobA/MobL family protein [Stappia sp. ICDLI1TA098]
MAIYSLNLKSIGRSTHAAGTAGAHLRYIARPDAQPELMAHQMPTEPAQARTWMNRAEQIDRVNARVIDKVRIALPRELTPEQRIQLVQDFARDLTGNRVPWFAAIHAAGKDAHNPHCHLVIRDRDIETGKRVLRLSDSKRDRAKAGMEPSAAEWVRAKWEDHANKALEQAGHEARIDRRTLEAQGIEREPTIHIGPQAQHVENFVERPQSKIIETGNGRTIDYPMIDAGRTRQERNAEIINFNLEKAARSPDFRTRETAKFEREQRTLDRVLENRLIAEARRRTLESRRLKSQIRADLSDVRENYRDEKQAMRDALRDDWKQKRSTLTARHQAERIDTEKSHNRFTARIMRVIDITGQTRQRQNAEMEDLKSRHKAERVELVQTHRSNRSIHSAAVEGRYACMKDEVKNHYRADILEMRERHKSADLQAEALRQSRATEREQAERRLDSQIRMAEKIARDRSKSRDRDRGPSLG